MKRPCKICWLILGLFLVGNFVLLGVWWLDDNHDNRFHKHEFSKEDHRMRMREHLRDNADIDQAQFDEMYALWKKHAEVMNAYQTEIDSIRHILMDKTFSVENDETKVNLLLDNLALKQRQIEETNYHHFRNMRQVCKNDEQREMLDRMFRSYIDKRGPSKHRRGRRSR